MNQPISAISISDFGIHNPSAFLEKRIQEDSNLEMEWLWAAWQITDRTERRYCLARALYINPDSQPAQQELQAFEHVSMITSDALVSRIRALLSRRQRQDEDLLGSQLEVSASPNMGRMLPPV